MFPLYDDNPTVYKTRVLYVLIGLNIFTWIFVQGLGFGTALLASVWKYGMISGKLLKLVPAGTQVPISQHLSYVIEESPRWYTLFSSMFMHGGWFHIIGNMWFMYVFGDNVEDVMGPVKFALFYIICGLAAAGMQMLMQPSSTVPMVGASGAISGVLGAYAVLYPKAPIHTLVFLGFFIQRIIVPAYVMLGYWFLLQIIGSLPMIAGKSGIAVGAHIGGFLAGILLVFIFRSDERWHAIRENHMQWKKWRR